MVYETEKIRNIAICGHLGTGKTSLVEQMLFNGGIIERVASVDSGRTVSDFTEEEIEHKSSIHSSLTNLIWKEKKINLFDTPGSSDFVAEVVSSFRASETAVMLIGARSGIQIETIKLWRRLNDRDMPRIVFINKMEKTGADFFTTLTSLREFKVTPIPLTIPMQSEKGYGGVINLMTMKAFFTGSREGVDIPKEYQEVAQEYHLKMIEMAAEGDDELMEKYFSKNDLTLEEAIRGLREGLFENRFVPVFCGSALENSGIIPLLDFLADESPAPGRVNEPCVKGENSQIITSDGEFSAVVFKTRIDKFAGKLSFVKVISGELKPGIETFLVREGKKERIGKIFLCEGKELKECGNVLAGDIAVLTKINSLQTSDTLCSQERVIHYRPLKLPSPVYSLAIDADSEKEEEKMAAYLHRVAEEDLTFTISFNEETRETVIAGMGEFHIKIILERLLKESKIHVSRRVPKVPYRETITKESEAEYTHKKQSGGHGQYGKISLRAYPLERGEKFNLINEIKGGAISKGYFQGIEKGLLEAMSEGFIAGYPLVDIGVSVFDGKEHAVDSSEMSFKLAAKHGLKSAIERSKPTLLEPVMELTVFVEDTYLGDILSDLSGKHGRVLEQNSEGGNIQSIRAMVPQRELMRYSIDLKSMTSGTGSFEMVFGHYEPVDGKVAQEIIKESQTPSD